MGVSLLAIVDVGLAANRTHHVTHVSLADHDLEMMMQTVSTHAALATRRIQHLARNTNICQRQVNSSFSICRLSVKLHL